MIFKTLISDITRYDSIIAKIIESGNEIDKIINLTEGLSKAESISVMTKAGLNDEIIEGVLATNASSSAKAKDIIATNAQTNAQISNMGVVEVLKFKYQGLAASIGLTTVGLSTLLGVAVGLSGMAFVMYKTSDAIKDVKEKVKELGEEFNSDKSDIEDYKSQIADLYKTINDSNSSIEDVTTARQTLMTIQDELIDKFGSEKRTIDLVTEAINGQSNALDILLEKQWLAAKNEFNKSGFWNNFANWQEGYDSNIDRMVDEMENGWANITLSASDYHSGKYDDIIKKLEKSGWKYSSSSETFVKGGLVENLYEELLDIQSLVGKDVPDNFLKSLTNDANKLKDILNDYESIWDNYVLNDKIFADSRKFNGKTLADSWKEANDAYADYQEAVKSGDTNAVEEATADYAQAISTVLNNENVDDSVKDYFKDMYPAIYREVEKWEFNVNILPKFDTHALHGMKREDILEMLTTKGNQYGEQTFNSILKLASDYGLVVGEDSEKIEQLLDLLEDWEILQKSVNEIAKEFTPFSKSQMINAINGMVEGFDVLDEIYADVYDKKSFDFTKLDTKKFEEAFKGLDEEYVAFIETVSSSPDDINACQEAFNSLVSAYIDSNDILANVSEETADLTAAMLKNMGVANAEEVVTSILTAKMNFLAQAKDNAAIEATNLDEATTTEIAALIDENGAVDESTLSIIDYYIAKINVNKNALSTENDIKALSNLIKALGGTTTALEEYARYKAVISKYTSYLGTGVYDDKHLNNAINTYTKLMNGAMEEAQAEINAVVNGTSYNPIYTGGDKTADIKKSIEDSKETFDWVETALSRIQRTITNLGKVVSATYRSWGKRNNALAQEMSAVNQEIAIQQNAYNAYMNKSNSVGLSDYYKNLVQSGGLNIEDITDEALADSIKLYQDYYEKALDASDAVEDLRANLAELAMTNFDNISKQYDEQISLIDHYTSMLEGYVSQSEAAGFWASEVYYQKLAEKELENISQLQSQYNSLITSFNESVSNGSIEKYSEDWYTMYESINEVEQAIQDANTALIEYNQTLQQIHWDLFDRSMDYKNNLAEEANFLIDMLDNYKLHNKNGSLTDKGLTVQGLHAMNYNVYMEESIALGEELQKINEEIANDPNDLTLIDRRNELLNLQQEAIKNALSEKEAIKDLVSDGYDQMLDALQELIDKRKEALQAEKD